MKKLLIYLVLLIIIVNEIFSQNRIDPASLRAYTDTIVNFDDTNIFAKDWNGYMIGWNYGDGGKEFDQLMSSNFYLHGWSSPIDFSKFGDNHYWYLTIEPLNQALYVGNDRGVIGTQALYYEPRINVVSDDSFTPDSINTGGAVFGFQNRNINLSQNDSCIIALPTLSTSSAILSNIWPKDELKFWDWITFSFIT